jgi:rubredoxin
MLIQCDVHGEVEAFPNVNGDVHCPVCYSFSLKEFFEDMESDFSMTGPEALKTSLENFDFFRSCPACGSEFPLDHVHTEAECLVHHIMNS